MVLYIRLDSYASHRTLKRGDEVSSAELAKATFREAVAKVIFTILILAYPTTIAILLGLRRKDYDFNVIREWRRYELVYMFNFIAIAILLVVSTHISLSHMRKVFGE
jgi:hypothetical protein